MINVNFLATQPFFVTTKLSVNYFFFGFNSVTLQVHFLLAITVIPKNYGVNFKFKFNNGTSKKYSVLKP